jgi:RNA polymerase sigma-70 factor (ECF subfamily)
MYVADAHNGVYRAYGLHVVTIAGDRITVVTGFEASVMPRFGLPGTLPGTD